jgi:hypothetical protein
VHTAFVLVAATCLTGTLPGFDGWDGGYPFDPSVIPCSSSEPDPFVMPCSADEFDPDVLLCGLRHRSSCGSCGYGGYGGYYDAPYSCGDGGCGWGGYSGWGYGGDGGWGGFYGCGGNGAYGTDWRCGTKRHCCRLLRCFHRRDDCGGWHPNPYYAGNNCGWDNCGSCGYGGASSGCGAHDGEDCGREKHGHGRLFARRHHRHDHDGPGPWVNPCFGPWDCDWSGGNDGCTECYGGPPVAPPAEKVPAPKN